MTQLIKKHTRTIVKTLLFPLFALTFLLTVASCDKEQHKYEGPAQLAFSQATYKFNITSSTGSVTIPIQLIANHKLNASGNVAVDPKSTCAGAVTLPAEFSIDPDTFSYDLPVTIDYSKLAAGNNTLILNLTSTLPVAEYYKTAIITLVKK